MVGDDRATVVGGMGPDREENRAFFGFTRAFRSIDLPVPELLDVDEPAGVWLEQDLGDATLFAALVAAREREGGPFPTAMLRVYEQVVELLPRFQIEGGRVIDYAIAYPRSAFDRQSILWDLNYFKYHFLKLAHVAFHEQRLENDFETLADFLLRADTSHFLYRDFQSRNIMLPGGQPFFIDYQGGRLGAPQYDIASLLYDAKAALPDEVRDHLLDHYLTVLERSLPLQRAAFLEQYRGYVLVRIMQALGAYGYRGFYERKARFLQSVPLAARNIEGLLARGLPVSLPELEQVFAHIVDEWADRVETPEVALGLTVHIGSFSFRQGYPADTSGHGGGFVFDCRAINNPGGLLEYQAMTGRDPDVAAFIEASPTSHDFWQNVRLLVAAQIDEYLKRGFTSLSVHFGCTGGQHRSVYFAERLATYIRHETPQVTVRLTHHEERNWPVREVPAADQEGRRNGAGRR
ncbi:MAG: phosphotransferase [Gemmatimonadetes bacterium]|nr:phosphotransferase [Gemmatimonadota bacterium]